MWNRRKDEDQPGLKTQNNLASQSDPNRDNLSTSSNLAPRQEPPALRAGTAIIGKSVVIKGNILSREDLMVDGELEGSIEAHEHRVTIGPNGRVVAGIKAREIVVQGSIRGNVEAVDRIDIRRDGKLMGDIKTARIVVEDGAFFKGSVDIVRPEVGNTRAAAAGAGAGTAAITPEVMNPGKK